MNKSEIQKQLDEARNKRVTAYGRYMYYECADLNYDHEGAIQAHNEYLKWDEEVKRLEKLLKQ